MPALFPPRLSDLEVRLGLNPGSLDGIDKTRAEAALADASALVEAEVSPTVHSRWTAKGAPSVVPLVVLTAARRGYENPRGINQETLGQHTVGLSESTGVYLTSREAAQITRAATRGAHPRPWTGTGSVRTPSAYGDGLAPPPIYLKVDGSRPVAFLEPEDLP